MATQILYIDFDGVVHPADVRVNARKGTYVRSPPGHNLFEHTELLAESLEPYPGVAIVLSTSWVQARGYRRACSQLPMRLRDRVIGATYHSRHMRPIEFSALPRGLQIWQDVVRRRPDSWLAVDDDATDWPDWARENLIQTNPEWGIADKTTMRALREALERQFGSVPPSQETTSGSA